MNENASEGIRYKRILITIPDDLYSLLKIIATMKYPGVKDKMRRAVTEAILYYVMININYINDMVEKTMERLSLYEELVIKKEQINQLKKILKVDGS